jgi:hypothetical protein
VRWQGRAQLVSWKEQTKEEQTKEGQKHFEEAVQALHAKHQAQSGEAGAHATLPAKPTFRGWNAGTRAIACVSEFAANAPGWQNDVPDVTLPPPAQTDEELVLLRQLADYRDGVAAEAMAQVSGIVEYFQGAGGFIAASHPRTTELCVLALNLAQFLVMHFKRRINRARPWQLDPSLMPPFDQQCHSAYPSGHATQAHLIAQLLLRVMPAEAAGRGLLVPLAHRIAINREVMGLHFRSDSTAGEILAQRALSLALGVAGWAADGTPPEAPNGTMLGEVLAAARAEWADARSPAAPGPRPGVRPVLDRPVRAPKAAPKPRPSRLRG